MEMPPDDEHSVSISSTEYLPNKPSKTTKLDEDGEKTEIYKNLIAILRQNDQPNMEYKVAIVEIFIFLSFVAIIIASFIALELKQQLLLGLNPWKWILLIGPVFCGLSMLRLGTFIILKYLIVPVLMLKKNVLFFACGLKKSVDILLWLGLILAFWLTWFRGGTIGSEVLHYINRTLIALVLGALFWILKNTLLLKLESDLHINRFFERIRSGVLHLHGIHMIDGEDDWKFEGIYKKEREKFFKNVHSMNRTTKKDVPTWVVERLADLFEKSMKKLPHFKDDEFCDDEMIIHFAVNNLLPKIIEVPADDKSKCKTIEQVDLKERAGLTTIEAKFLLNLLRKFGSAVDTKTFLIWVTHAYRTCWLLRHSLGNSRGALNQLNMILTSFLVIVVIVIWLLLTEIATQSSLALAFSPFLAASFIFGDSCKTMFQGIIFVFVTHPFDVDDECIIDDKQMKVDKVNILTTEFRQPNGEPVLYPNSVLATKHIVNSYSAPNQSDILVFDIDDAIRPELIEKLNVIIERYLDMSYYLCSEVQVLREDLGKITVHFRYLVPHLSSIKKTSVKSDLRFHVMEILENMKMFALQNRFINEEMH